MDILVDAFSRLDQSSPSAALSAQDDLNPDATIHLFQDYTMPLFLLQVHRVTAINLLPAQPSQILSLSDNSVFCIAADKK